MILLAVDYINKDCRMPEIESHNKHVNTCICDVPSMPFPLLIVSVFFVTGSANAFSYSLLEFSSIWICIFHGLCSTKGSESF